MNAKKKVSVLIAEDEEDSLNLWQQIAEMEGASVITATNGAAALRTLDATQPNLLITDIQMPVMSGIELIKKIRKTVSLTGLPIIALSSGSAEFLDEALAVGATRAIDKFLFDRIVETIKEFLHCENPVHTQLVA